MHPRPLFDPRLISVATTAARRAARVLQDEYRADPGVECLAGRDIKTRADRMAETCVLKFLTSTNIEILAEESGGVVPDTDTMRWIVDALDGTMNFVRRIPLSCISIALWHGNQPLLGVVVDLTSEDLYVGIVGTGATVNGQAITCSTTTEASQAILATGFPVGRSFATSDLGTFVHRIQRFKKVRMIGSAALSLAWVARGRFDAYQETNIRVWDVAAGLALVAAAGGLHTPIRVDNDGYITVFAASESVFAQETSP